MSRSSCGYRSRCSDGVLREQLQQLARENPRIGYCRLHVLLRRDAVVGSFHGKLRDECLNTSWFWNLFDARRKIGEWQQAYNSNRPHSSLDYKTPNEFTAFWQANQASATLRSDPPALLEQSTL